ncbi:hypothetical protein Hte_002153 [Hypoxylon texense]
MTSAEPLVYYPAYCFHLSPTINKWCPLRAVDIQGLECRPGFEADNVFFSLNHPIRWVRVVGVVVAIDEYYGRRIYTVDDSTGECIECSLDVPKPADNARSNVKKGDATTANPTEDAPHSDIDVGMVIDVKGSTKLFRDQKQVNIQKLQRVRSTNQEVQFWNKIRDFRRDVLSQPWVLEKREVRQCKKQYMTDADAEEKKRKRKEENGYTHDSNSLGRHTSTKSGDARSKPTKREPLARTGARYAHAKGQYDALGL